jgi:uncharacterized protein (DUF362 family)/Pyruvate/2-oxoacid:ferredoxin oxidoreductase delta subunit
LIRLVRDCGATPVVADSPAAATKLQRVWEKTGFESLCREESVPLLSLEQGGSVACRQNGYAFSVARAVMEADLIINVPKVKTHVLTTLTAGVKNLYGTLPGFQKAMLHARHPSVSDFGRLVDAVRAAMPPVLSVADGIVAMEGDGPSGGNPVTLGFLAASGDTVALDLVLCDLLGIHPRTVPYLRGQAPLTRRRDIDVRGAAVDDMRAERFRLPGTVVARMIPAAPARLLGRLIWIRPTFSDACTRCGRCAKGCPTRAITMTHNETPKLSGQMCIGCCCCHEVCPARAVTMTPSPLVRFIRRGKPL